MDVLIGLIALLIARIGLNVQCVEVLRVLILVLFEIGSIGGLRFFVS